MSDRKAELLILGAMKSETELLISALDNAEKYITGNFCFYSGMISGKNVTVGRCLVGTAYSAAACALAIERFSPDGVIVCGTAGGHDPSLHRGDIVLGRTVINAGRYNTPHAAAGAGSDSLSWTIPESDCFEAGGHTSRSIFTCNDALLEAARSVEYSGGRVVEGTVLSSDAWNRELDRIEHYHRVYSSSCEDMESFSVAELCDMYSLPWIAVRIISNSELYPEESADFVRFGGECQKFVLRLIEKI